MAPGMDKMGLEGQISEAEHSSMIWKGLQGGPGGILTEMFPSSSAAAAVAAQMQAQENLLRLQQQQQTGGGQHRVHPPPPGPHIISQADMARMFQPSHGYVPAQSPPPSGNFVLPPGPRPRPVGGDDTSPGYTPDTVPGQAREKEDLVIGSWNEECEKDSAGVMGGIQL